MKTGSVWEIVTASLWLCQAAASIPITPKVAIERLGGKWYPIAVVRDPPLKEAVYAYRIEPVDHKDFLLIQAVPHKGQCNNVSHHLHAMQGNFRTSDSKKVVHFVDTDYDNYHIALFGQGSDAALFLYARGKEVSGKVKARLQRQALKWGFKASQIVYNPKTVLCPPSHAGETGSSPEQPLPSQLQRHGGTDNVFCNLPYLFYFLPWWPGLCNPLQNKRVQ